MMAHPVICVQVWLLRRGLSHEDDAATSPLAGCFDLLIAVRLRHQGVGSEKQLSDSADLKFAHVPIAVNPSDSIHASHPFGTCDWTAHDDLWAVHVCGGY